jgi:PhnB protein
MTEVTAYLSVDGAADAIDFYTRAFGAQEQFRLPMPDGRVGHAELKIGISTLMLADEFPEMNILGPKARGGPTSSFSIVVDSIDALDSMWAQAVDAGAQVERAIEDQFYGHRMGQLVDPFGHRWSISTVVEDVSPEEMKRRMADIDYSERLGSPDSG